MAAKGTSSSSGHEPDPWRIYKRQPGIVLGFHGCDKATGMALLAGDKSHLSPSKNLYDWLGDGIYFWEADPWRALEWAQQAVANPKQTSKPVREPYVVGAVIDLGHCFNLLDVDSCAEAANAFKLFAAAYESANIQIPENKGEDGVLRFRDRWVIDAVHKLRTWARQSRYDSVRAAFPEGGPLYEGAGLREKSHIQIAVRNKTCIKGYFRLPGL